MFAEEPRDSASSGATVGTTESCSAGGRSSDGQAARMGSDDGEVCTGKACTVDPFVARGVAVSSPPNNPCPHPSPTDGGSEQARRSGGSRHAEASKHGSGGGGSASGGSVDFSDDDSAAIARTSSCGAALAAATSSWPHSAGSSDHSIRGCSGQVTSAGPINPGPVCWPFSRAPCENDPKIPTG